MRRSSFTTAVCAVCVVVLPFAASGETRFASKPDDAAFRLLVHAAQNLDPEGDLQLRFHVIPAGDLANGQTAPLAFLGFRFFRSESGAVELEPALGFHFPDNEPIFSGRIALRGENWWGWVDAEWRLDRKAYGFFQGEGIILPWLNAGGECEGSGPDNEVGAWNAGCGPNVVWLVNSHAEVNLVVRAQYIPSVDPAGDDVIRPKICTRFHLKF